MRIILTNDDGIDAPGLEALCDACAGMGDALVVAPDRCHSSMSHRVTTDRAIEVVEIAPGRFRVEGAPADCARIAVTCLAPKAEWVISGINRGGNLGADIHISGTVAAAREAALLGCHAAAVSQYVARGREVNWSLSAKLARAALERVRDEEQGPGIFGISICLIRLKARESRDCVLRRRSIAARCQVFKTGSAYRYCGQYQERPRIPGCDVERCFGGDITVTKLKV